MAISEEAEDPPNVGRESRPRREFATTHCTRAFVGAPSLWKKKPCLCLGRSWPYSKCISGSGHQRRKSGILFADCAAFPTSRCATRSPAPALATTARSGRSGRWRCRPTPFVRYAAGEVGRRPAWRKAQSGTSPPLPWRPSCGAGMSEKDAAQAVGRHMERQGLSRAPRRVGRRRSCKSRTYGNEVAGACRRRRRSPIRARLAAEVKEGNS